MYVILFIFCVILKYMYFIKILTLIKIHIYLNFRRTLSFNLLNYTPACYYKSFREFKKA